MSGMEGIQTVGAAHRRVLGQEFGAHMGGLGEDGPSFAETLQKALGDISELQGTADDAIGAFLAGEPIEIHEVMAATEEAGIALEMLIEIRNKLTEAYRTVSQMQQ